MAILHSLKMNKLAFRLDSGRPSLSDLVICNSYRTNAKVTEIVIALSSEHLTSMD